MFGDKKDEDRARKADERRQARGECIEVRRAEAKKSRRDLIRTCVGRSLVGQGATGIFHCQENLERARRENSPSTALIDSSVLAMAYTLSARISPKKPARIRVEMTRPVETEQFTIAPYTALSSDQFALFNRRAITCEAEEAEALAAYRLAVLRATEEVENSFSALVKREA
jgi:hypothetical protein